MYTVLFTEYGNSQADTPESKLRLALSDRLNQVMKAPTVIPPPSAAVPNPVSSRDSSGNTAAIGSARSSYGRSNSANQLQTADTLGKAPAAGGLSTKRMSKSRDEDVKDTLQMNENMRRISSTSESMASAFDMLLKSPTPPSVSVEPPKQQKNSAAPPPPTPSSAPTSGGRSKGGGDSSPPTSEPVSPGSSSGSESSRSSRGFFGSKRNADKEQPKKKKSASWFGKKKDQ